MFQKAKGLFSCRMLGTRAQTSYPNTAPNTTHLLPPQVFAPNSPLHNPNAFGTQVRTITRRLKSSILRKQFTVQKHGASIKLILPENEGHMTLPDG